MEKAAIASQIKLYSESFPTFLQDHPKLNQAVRDVFNYLYEHPSHHPLVSGPGISLSVDYPYSMNHMLNLFRKSYLRQNFGEDIKSSEKRTQRNTCYRATYATACGLGRNGTPPW